VICMASMLLTACGGSSASSASSGAGGVQGASTSTVGGAVAGLGSATGLVLANGADTLNAPAGATSFTMRTRVADGQAYDITVEVHRTAPACKLPHRIRVPCGIHADDLARVHSLSSCRNAEVTFGPMTSGSRLSGRSCATLGFEPDVAARIALKPRSCESTTQSCCAAQGMISVCSAPTDLLRLVRSFDTLALSECVRHRGEGFTSSRTFMARRGRHP
jgi:hypothetical protein